LKLIAFAQVEFFDTASSEFQDRAGSAAAIMDNLGSRRFEALEQSYDVAMSLDEDKVDGKAHTTGMDTSSWGQEQGFVSRQAGMVK